MKISLSIIGSLFVLLLVSHNAYSQGHQIEFDVDGLEDQEVIVGYHLGKQRLVHDTLNSVAGKLLLKGPEPLPSGVYFLYANTFYFEFIVHEQSFKLSFDKNAAYSSLQSEGSKENALFAQFQYKMGNFQKEQRALSQELQEVKGEDSLAVRDKLQKLSVEMSAARSSLVKTNEGTYFSDFIQLMIGIDVPDMADIEDEGKRKMTQYEYYRNHYLDLVEDPERLMRTPVIHEYVMKYFSEVSIPQPDSITLAVDGFLSRTTPESESFRYWLVTLFNYYQESKIMGMDAVTVDMAEKYYLSGMASWVTDESKAEIQKELRFIKPNLIGKPAPDMYLVDTSMQVFKVQSIQTPYLVLYFYDPDCGVCRKKTPILKENYDALKNEGAEVLAICTTTEEEKWKDYIKKNDLDWMNAADPEGKSLFRIDYNIRSTPQLYILGPQRKIVAKKLDVGQLVGFIQDHKSLQKP